MPAEAGPSGRRSFRKMSSEEEAEIRRARGEISCAECRRLKLKCDKKLPCSSCVRRGCPSICPNGTLTTGHGTRYILADTAQLHQKIAEMGQRIRQLEDALSLLQSSVSKEEHPLLIGKQLMVKFGPEVQDVHHRAEPPPIETPDITTTNTLNALGTLTIDDCGHAKYFGTSAGTEALLFAGLDGDANGCETNGAGELSEEPDYAIPQRLEILRLSNTFPLDTSAPWDIDKTLASLYDALPSQPRAWTLCETFWQHASFMFRPVQRDELIDEILIPVYKLVKEEGGYARTDIVSAHKLAILFLVFSVGSLLDLTLSPYSPEAESFYHCGKCAMYLRPIFDSPELATVQAVSMIAFYHTLGGPHYSVDTAWVWFSVAQKLSQSLGLHRDPARWSLDPKTVQRRRFLFWELYAVDFTYSSNMGRPPAIRSSYVDCEFPVDDEEFLDESGQRQIGFYTWKREFTKDIMSRIVEECLSAQPTSYQSILDWDRKAREKPMPSHLNKNYGPDEEVTIQELLKGANPRWYKIHSVLFMHKAYFTQAMLDHPVEPLRSPYAPSFLAACRCASLIIEIIVGNFKRFPEYCARLWTNWTHLFTASTIVSMLVSRFPSSEMAPKAFVELGQALELFKAHASSCSRARNGLVLLTRMKDKALESYSQYTMGSPLKAFSVVNDDLAIFGGQTRVLVSKNLNKKGRRRTVDSSADSDTVATTPEHDSSSLSHGSTEDFTMQAQNQLYQLAPNCYPSFDASHDYFGEFPNQASQVPDWGSTLASYDNPPPMSTLHNIPPMPDSVGSEFLGRTPTEAAQVGMSMMSETGLQNEQWMEFMRQSGILGDFR